MRRLTWLAWWLILIVVLAAAWTLHEQFAWSLAAVLAGLPEFGFGWLMNTLMFGIVLGLPAIVLRWRGISNPKGPAGMGSERGSGSNAHLLLQGRHR